MNVGSAFLWPEYLFSKRRVSNVAWVDRGEILSILKSIGAARVRGLCLTPSVVAALLHGHTALQVTSRGAAVSLEEQGVTRGRSKQGTRPAMV